MNHNLDTLFEAGKRVSMTDKERSLMCDHVHTFVANNPIVVAQIISTPIVSPYRSFTVFFRSRRALMLTIVLVVFVGTGSVLAQNALPGSLLYGVKTGVNERVRGWFAVSPEAKAKWELTLADTRLSEVEELHRTNSLSPDDDIMLEKSIEAYTSAALSEVHATGSPFSLDSFGTAKAKLPPVTEADIDALKQTFDFQKFSLQSQAQTLTAQGIFIETKATLIKARTALLDAESALKAGNVEEASRLYGEAKSFVLPDTEATSTSSIDPTILPSDSISQMKQDVKTILKINNTPPAASSSLPSIQVHASATVSSSLAPPPIVSQTAASVGTAVHIVGNAVGSVVSSPAQTPSAQNTAQTIQNISQTVNDTMNTAMAPVQAVISPLGL